MAEIGFTAGITFQDDRALTVDVTAIDGNGITYTAEEGPQQVAWSEIKAVMLATTDHMLESAGSLFTMAERMQAAGDEGGEAAREMRAFGFGVLQQAAPRVCPRGEECGLRPGAAPPPEPAA